MTDGLKLSAAVSEVNSALFQWFRKRLCLIGIERRSVISGTDIR